jgi:hypothetical protein
LTEGGGELAAELLDVGGDDDGLQLLQGDAAGVAPGEKPPHGVAVGAAGVGVADLGREVLDEAAGGPLAGPGDDRREPEAVPVGDRGSTGR